MSRIMLISYLETKTSELREEFTARFQKLADYVWANEPKTFRYCLCKPYEEDDGVSLYIIEEHLNSDAFTTHTSTPQFKDLLTFLTDPSNPITTQPPTVHTNNITLSNNEIYSYTRPTINDHPGAYIILATVKYLPGKTTSALPGWKEIVRSCEETEESTLTYTVIEDKQDNVIRTVESYVNKNYARTVHMHGPAVKFNQDQNMEMRDGGKAAMNVKRGVKAAGFMGRV